MFKFIKRFILGKQKNTTFDPHEYFPLENISASFQGRFKEIGLEFEFKGKHQIIGITSHKKQDLYIMNRTFVKLDGSLILDEDIYFSYSQDGNTIERHGQFKNGMVSFYPIGGVYLTNHKKHGYRYDKNEKFDTVTWKWTTNYEHKDEMFLLVKKKFFEGKKLLRVEKMLLRKVHGLWSYEERNYFPSKNIVKYKRINEIKSQVYFSSLKSKIKIYIPILIEHLDSHSVIGYVLIIHKDVAEDSYYSTKIGNPINEIIQLIEEHFSSYNSLELLNESFQEENAKSFMYICYDKINCLVVQPEKNVMNVFFLNDSQHLTDPKFSSDIINLWNQLE